MVKMLIHFRCTCTGWPKSCTAKNLKWNFQFFIVMAMHLKSCISYQVWNGLLRTWVVNDIFDNSCFVEAFWMKNSLRMSFSAPNTCNFFTVFEIWEINFFFAMHLLYIQNMWKILFFFFAMRHPYLLIHLRM